MIEINNKEIPNCNYKKKEFIPSYSIYVFIYLLSIFGSISLVELEIDFIQNKYNNIIVNTVWAAALADEINGTENADTINGTINKDVIKGLDGNDTLAGKEAGDNISGGSGDDMIYGNEGRDSLKGKAGNDNIEGAEGNDKIFGDRGNDMLMGGPGDDTLTGGLGTDKFICGTAIDTITDFNATQKDTTPENDCENIENQPSGNGENNNDLSIQQQQDSTLENKGIEQTTANTTQKTDEQKQDN